MEKLQLLLWPQHEDLLHQLKDGDCFLQLIEWRSSHLARGRNIDEAVDVYVDEGGHQELTVEPVHDSSMSRNDVAEVFDLESPLEAGGKESTEGPDNGCEE